MSIHIFSFDIPSPPHRGQDAVGYRHFDPYDPFVACPPEAETLAQYGGDFLPGTKDIDGQYVRLDIGTCYSISIYGAGLILSCSSISVSWKDIILVCN